MTIIGVILNKAKNTAKIKHIEAILNKPVLAKLPYDNSVIESVNNKQPIFLSSPKNKLSKTISELADLMNV